MKKEGRQGARGLLANSTKNFNDLIRKFELQNFFFFFFFFLNSIKATPSACEADMRADAAL